MRFGISNKTTRTGNSRSQTTRTGEARAKRARDHLARKRQQERHRIERERGRAASSDSRAQTRVMLTPLLFVFAFVAGVTSASWVSEFFLLRQAPIQRITVQGAIALTPDAVAKSLGIVAGRSLESIRPQEIETAAANEPWIKSIRSLRLPNGTLIISIVEREAVARWLTPEQNNAAAIELIDHRGLRFPGHAESRSPLPLVLGVLDKDGALPLSAITILEEIRNHAEFATDPGEIILHLPVKPKGIATADLLGLHQEEANPPEQIDDEADMQSGYVLQIGEQGPRALLGKRFFTQRIARLATYLESEESKRIDAHWIDLRYADRAVLRTEPAPG